MSSTQPSTVSGGIRGGRDARSRDRRVDRRYELHGVEGSLVYRWEIIPCDFIDISLSGCCLRTREYFEPGALASVEVTVPLLGVPVQLNGVTQWVARNRLVGVRFVHPSVRTKNELASLLSGLEDEAAAEVVKAALSNSPQVKAHGLVLSKGMVMTAVEEKAPALENAQGQQPDPSIEAEWEEARRRWEEEERLETPGAQEDIEITPVQPEVDRIHIDVQAQAPERPPWSMRDGEAEDRRTPNNSQEEWSATVRFLATDAEVSGVLVDLSLTGCTFEMRGLYPGAAGCGVEVEFQLRGLHFRMAGDTRSVKGKHTAEIGFHKMIRHRQEELAQVLEELTEQNRRTSEMG